MTECTLVSVHCSLREYIDNASALCREMRAGAGSVEKIESHKIGKGTKTVERYVTPLCFFYGYFVRSFNSHINF